MFDRRRIRAASDDLRLQPRRARALIPLLALALCLAGGVLALALAAPTAQAAPLPGDITGTVTNAGGTGLANIDVTAYQSDGYGDWNYVSDVYTGIDGSYDFGSLDAGTYRLQFYDYSGDYMMQYYDNLPDLYSATDVVVNSGETTSGIDAALALSGHISGTISAPGSPDLSNVDVTAYESDGYGDWNYVNDVYAASDGTYDLGSLASGTYHLRFHDYSGACLTQYYSDKATVYSATDVPVTAPDTTSGIDATLALAGHISGTISAPGSPDLSNVDVTAYQPDGYGDWNYVGDVYADSNGTYDLGGLASGTDYRVEFDDDSGAYLTQCYNNKATLDAADAITVTAGSTTSGIDATLAVAGRITGTVTNESHVGVGDFYVGAYQSDGSGGWDRIGSAWTASDGTYSIGGLTTGSYRVEFDDYDNGIYASQCYSSKPTLDAADPVSVTTGAATPSINAVLTSASAKAITAFGFKGLTPAAAGTITEATHAIAVTVPYGTNVGALVASFTTTGVGISVGGTPQVSEVTALNFINPVTYRVTAFDDSTQDYVVTVTVAAAPAPTPTPTPTPISTPTMTLKLSGLKSGAMKLGKRLTAKGAVTPISLAGSKVTLTAQLKKGKKWVKAKTGSATITSTGAYSWKYKPAKKGAYRLRATIAKTATNAAAKTKWLAFKVK